MEQLAPLGPVYQAGTLSGNPVAMAAGAATFADSARRRRRRLRPARESRCNDCRTDSPGSLRKHGRQWSVARIGSILWLSLQDGEVPRRYEDINPECAETYAALHSGLLDSRGLVRPFRLRSHVRLAGPHRSRHRQTIAGIRRNDRRDAMNELGIRNEELGIRGDLLINFSGPWCDGPKFLIPNSPFLIKNPIGDKRVIR